MSPSEAVSECLKHLAPGLKQVELNHANTFIRLLEAVGYTVTLKRREKGQDHV